MTERRSDQPNSDLQKRTRQPRQVLADLVGDRALFPTVERERLAGAEAADLFTLQLSRDATVKSHKANFSVQDK